MRPQLKILIASLLAVSLPYSYAAQVEKSDIAIDNIQIGQLDGDTQPSQFSVIFNFKNNGDTVNNWKFGFYMPRTFFTNAAQKINPDLEMQICDAATTCTNLRYIKTLNPQQADTSQGYFTLLEPIGQFPLQEKHRYYIQLAHSNQWNAGNISALPQNLFFIQDDGQKNGIPRIYTVNTELSQYNLQGYNAADTENAINSYLQKNWQTSAAVSNRPVNVIPAPVAVTSLSSNLFNFPKTIAIHNQLSADNTIATQWAPLLKQDWKLKKLPLIDNSNDANDGIIISEIANPKIINNNPEGYQLTINDNSIQIAALTPTGVYYAFQTLRQLALENPNGIPEVSITDYPRFKYRGVGLDVARHYFTVNEIKSLIDVMAAQKLNSLHLHLSDDEAFRLAMPNYPNLATVGAMRGLGQLVGPQMLLQNNLDTTNLSQQSYPIANSNYGYSYSPEDIKQIISYANQNQITVIPEIDLPGHARSLIKALPTAMIDPNDSSQFVSVQGYTDDVLPVCTYGNNISVGNQFTQAINDITVAIANQFNQQTTLYAVNNEVSLGGDEVSANAWTNDTSCRNEWSNLSALEKSHLFFARIAESNSSLMISGWQQYVQNDNDTLGKNIVPSAQSGHVWVWMPSQPMGMKQAVNLANKNYPTILAYADKTYFDLAYSSDMYEPGFTWATPNADTYTALSAAQAAIQTQAKTANPQNILGLEGELFSENLPSYQHLMYMALPKMPAMAEAAWSPAYVTIQNNQLNWQDLATRLGCGKDGFLAYMQKLYGINYRGYPNGIAKEVPPNTICQASAALLLNDNNNEL